MDPKGVCHAEQPYSWKGMMDHKQINREVCLQVMALNRNTLKG
jgi:hypothetical protein